jgi:hypothetical protein
MAALAQSALEQPNLALSFFLESFGNHLGTFQVLC